jgi:hypothetical protein
LIERDDPVPLVEALVGNDVGIGRAGALDNANGGQKSVPAARSARPPSGPINR